MIKKFLQSHPVHKKIAPIFDTIFLLRPTIFFSVWVMVVVGIISADLNMHAPSLWNTGFSWQTFSVFSGLTLLISAAFISNQIADEHNGQDKKKLLLIGKHISSEKGKSIVKILLIIGGLISIISNWVTAIPAMCVYFLWGIQYNHPPFEWKNTPTVSWLVNSCVGVLLFIIGWMLGMKNYPNNAIIPLSVDTLSHMLPYLLCFSAVSLLITLPDRKNDDSEMRTFSILFGFSTSIVISLLMVSIALYVSLKHADPLASTATLVSLPFFIFAAVRRMNKDILRAIRYPIFILNFFALPYYPLLVVPLFCTYYLSKYYYWHRFDLHYPTFLVDND